MKKSIFFKWLGIIFVSLTLIIGLIPTIISSSWGKAKVEKLINRSIAGHVSLKNIHANFFGPQQLEHVVLNDPDGQFVLSIENMQVDHSLISLLFQNFSPANLQVHNLNLNLVEGERGDSNVLRTLRPNNSPFTTIGAPIYFHAEKVDLAYASNFFSIMANGTTYQEALEGLFTINMTLTGLTEDNIKQLADSPELLMQPNTHFHVDAKIKNMPVALIDLALAMKDPNLRGLAEQAFGPQLNLDVRNVKSDKNLALEVNASSTHVNAHLIVDLSQERISITKPGTIRLSIAPSLLQYFLNPKFDIQLKRPTQLLFAIEQFDLPINKDTLSYDFGLATIKGRLDLQEAILASRVTFNDILLDHLSATFNTTQDSPELALKISGQASQNGDPVQIAFETWIDKTKRLNFRLPPPIKVNLKHIPLALVDELLSLGNLLETQAGKYGDLTIDTILQKNALDMAIEFASEKIRVSSMVVHINEDISLIEPITIEYKLDTQKFDSFEVPSQLIKLQAYIHPIRDFLRIKDVSQLNLSGTVLADSIALNTNRLKEKINFQAVEFPWEVYAKENKVRMRLQSKIYLDQSFSGRVNQNIILTNWLTNDKIDLQKAFISAKIDLKDVSHQVISIFNQELELAELIGPKVNLSVDGNLSIEKKQGNASVNFSGEGLQGNGRIKIDYPAIALSPFTLDLTITPERFQAMRHLIKGDANEHLTLADSAHLKLQLEGMREGEKIRVNAKANTDQLVVLDITSGSSLTFKNIQASVVSNDLYETLDFNVTAKQKSSGQTSDFVAKGVVENAFLPSGTFNKNHLTLLLDVKISELPLNLFCDTFCVDKSISQKVEALFGSTLNVNIYTALKDSKGPIVAALDGPNGDVQLDARLDKGNLYLNHPFQAKFKVTKALGHSILQDIFPLLSGTVSADQPFTITLDDKGFSFPLFNFDTKLIQIAKGTLSLGNVKFTKDGQLGEILTLLTPPDADLISVWFTPLYFNMNKGELHLARIDMLISNHFPVAAWGTLNFPKDRTQMVIGLSGDAISYAFDVNVDSAYILQLPLKGKIASPSLDKRNATTKIGALVAHSQKSTQGTIIGTVLDLASGGLTQENPPRPTTNPFPWEKQTQADRKKRAKESPSETSEEKSVEPEKMIEKAANTLLDNFFK